MHFRPLPPLDQLNRKLAYDPESGLLTWRTDGPCRRAGDEAGWYVAATGFRVIRWGKEQRQFQVNRICWWMGTEIDPTGFWVDNIDCNNVNNALKNLRLCTRQQYLNNRPRNRRNKSGYKNIVWRHGNWRVSVQSKVIGKYADLNDALDAADQARRAAYGEFAIARELADERV